MTDQQAAVFNAGRQQERADFIAWLEQGEGYDDIIDLIKQGAHEGCGDD